MMVKHTPTPWTHDVPGLDIRGADDKDIAVAIFQGIDMEVTPTRAATISAVSRDAAHANAALIVEACNNHERLLADLERVQKERDEAKKDAERYRFLRDKNNPLERFDQRTHHDNGTSCYHAIGGVSELKYGEELDAAIDSALSRLASKDRG